MALDLSGYDIPATPPTAAAKVEIVGQHFGEVAAAMPPGGYDWVRTERRDIFDTILSAHNDLDAACESDDLAQIRQLADRCRRLWLRAWDICREALTPVPEPQPVQGALL